MGRAGWSRAVSLVPWGISWLSEMVSVSCCMQYYQPCSDHDAVRQTYACQTYLDRVYQAQQLPPWPAGRRWTCDNVPPDIEHVVVEPLNIHDKAGALSQRCDCIVPRGDGAAGTSVRVTSTPLPEDVHDNRLFRPRLLSCRGWSNSSHQPVYCCSHRPVPVMVLCSRSACW